MKFTTKILVGMLFLLFVGLLSSNILLKKEFDKIDKSDNYWNYTSVSNKPFKFLKIVGGNGTKIAFEQSPNCSVKILNEWKNWFKGEVKAKVNNDTLYINYDFVPDNKWNKDWLKEKTTVRIFSPELLVVDANNTNFEMYKLKQKSIHLYIHGKSKFEVESLLPSLDSLTIIQNDSSIVVFEMSPDFKPAMAVDSLNLMQNKNGNVKPTVYEPLEKLIKSPEAMNINFVNANLLGYTLLDLGHAQIQSLDLKITDSSAIILSGGALKKLKN